MRTIHHHSFARESLRPLDEQLQTEKQLWEMYEQTSDLFLNESAGWLHYILQMDSQKHIAIFNLATEIMEGQRIGEPDRQEISVGLGKRLELENESIERSRKILSKRFVKENNGLGGLLETQSGNERPHHKTLQWLRDERFARMNAFDAYTECRRTSFEQLANEIKRLAMKHQRGFTRAPRSI